MELLVHKHFRFADKITSREANVCVIKLFVFDLNPNSRGLAETSASALSPSLPDAFNSIYLIRLLFQPNKLNDHEVIS
jgi:hypothetical protein